MTESWYWIAIDEGGAFHKGRERSLEAAQAATADFPVRSYSTSRDQTMSAQDRLYEIWARKQLTRQTEAVTSPSGGSSRDSAMGEA